MSGVVRQSTPPDLSLRIGSTPPPAPPPPPVVVPRRREPGYEPQLEAEETGPAFVPVVSRGAAVVEAGPAMPAVPPPALTPVTLWAAPVPSFTYLAGAAGSGKTFATKEWAARDPGLILCATTGIAAINLGGETINSVLGYFDTQSLQEQFITGFLTARLGKLWKAGVRRIVLDEVSMLAGDQLTYLVRAVEEVNGRG
ncbi:MAG TPA: AAA family ATPase, partial [Chloroflexota bacterium]|nr:AAA family ATPase [Chloroflexota bacterium]